LNLTARQLHEQLRAEVCNISLHDLRRSSILACTNILGERIIGGARHEDIISFVSLGDSDRELVRQVEGLLESQGLRIRTGEELGGAELTPEIKARIAKCDGLVALMTKRVEPPDYGGNAPVGCRRVQPCEISE